MNETQASPGLPPPAPSPDILTVYREALEAIASPGTTADYGWWTEAARKALRRKEATCRE